MATFNTEVKYRGCIQVTHWAPSPGQPRPGLIEANACVKRIFEQPKQSTTVVVSCSVDGGIKCVDTAFTPPKIVMKNSVYEIAHCGVDVSKPRLFTCIVGTKGDNPQFFCHVFKCESKDAASQTTRAVAAVCTEAFQSARDGGGGGGGGGGSKPPPAKSSGARNTKAAPVDEAKIARQKKMRRASLKKAPTKIVVIAKLTDDWFVPDMGREEVQSKLREARVGDFFCRESKSNPGDYAISVQSGKNLWTGLIHQSDDGFQLGNKGNVLFDELVELISYYMGNSFMNDDFGYPLMLRAPRGQEESFPAPAPPSETESFPPPKPPSAAASPDGGWPSEEESGTDSDQEDDMAEFERFMDSAAARGDVMDADGEVNMDALNGIMATMGPGTTGASAAARAPAPMLPPPAPKKTLKSQAQQIFDTLPKDEENCLSGAAVRPVLMKSGLEIAMLGKVWMDVDSTRRGKIDLGQLGLMLGMIYQVQQGVEPNLATLDAAKCPCPTIPNF